MNSLKCRITVQAGVIVGVDIQALTRQWDITQDDLDNPPRYLDTTGAAMNYAMSLQNPEKVNWVRLDWLWY